MPKERKETHSEFILRVKESYPKVFQIDKSVLFCLFCDREVAAKKLFQVKQHIASAKHKSAENRKNNQIKP